MHLKKITLNNFRCFENFEVDLHPRLTVIVADNGGGKSTILDGIAIGLSPVMRVLSSANQRLEGPGIKDNDFRSVTAGKARSEIRSDYAQVILESTTGLKWDNWRPSSKGLAPPKKVGQSDLNSLGAILESYKEENQPKLLPVFAYYGALRGGIVIPERLRTNTKNDLNYEYPTSGLFGALDAVSDFKEMLKWFDAEESSELREQKEADYPCSSIALDAVRDSIGMVLGDKFSKPHFDSKHKFVIHSTGDPKKLQISQLSQGYQSMLALVMDFARRLALANRHLAGNAPDGLALVKTALEYFHHWNQTAEDEMDFLEWLGRGPVLAPAIMLVDEIDLHLHPSWQQKVIRDLMRAFPLTQFIVTTHSPQVVSTVRKENIRILHQMPDGAWLASAPDRNPYSHSNSVALETVMGGDAYPPSEIVRLLREYQRLVGIDEHDSPRALELRTSLEAEWGSADPELLRMDVSIRKNETLRQLRNPKP